MDSFGRFPLAPQDDAVQASQNWWDENANYYLAEHGEILGDNDFLWGPEGLREADIQLLGTAKELKNKHVLEIGAGAAQCSRYLAQLGISVHATDLSPAMMAHAQTLNQKAGVNFPLTVANALALPFAAESFDIIFTSFGVIPFIADLDELNLEVKRVLRPGGIWVYSAMHPVRWMFPDDPSPKGMTITNSYFQDQPYQERDAQNQLTYAEFPHSLAKHINSLASTGFHIQECIEPQWQAGRKITWGGWGPYRSQFLPGTLILKSQKPT